MNYLTSDMLAIADEKYLQMLELLRLTKEQTTLLVYEDVERLGRHVVFKQNIIDRVDSLDARYKELNAKLLLENNVCSMEDLKDDRHIQKVMELNSKTKSIVKEMMEIDKKNAEMGKQLLEKLGEALKHVSKAHAVSRAYQGDMSGAIFVDRQG